MKYELEPDNRNCADQVLLDDLRHIANLLAKATLTKEEYDKHGRFPAGQVGVTLVIDHITAWSDGGETVMDNLQTPCEPCNGGKSDLAMMDDAD